MASISRDKNGNRTIQFVGGDKKRRSIRLGKTPAKAADAIKAKVESLNAAVIAGISWDGQTADWVARLNDAMYDKLAKAGLVPRRGRGGMTSLGAFLGAYIESRNDVKPSTARHLRECAKRMTNHFGADSRLEDIFARRRR